MKVSEYFKGARYVQDTFRNAFFDIDVELLDSLQVEIIPLGKTMTDQEIWDEHSGQSALAELIFAMKNGSFMKDGSANICFCEDGKGQLWGIGLRWEGGWRVFALPVERKFTLFTRP